MSDTNIKTDEIKTNQRAFDAFQEDGTNDQMKKNQNAKRTLILFLCTKHFLFGSLHVCAWKTKILFFFFWFLLFFINLLTLFCLLSVNDSCFFSSLFLCIFCCCYFLLRIFCVCYSILSIYFLAFMALSCRLFFIWLCFVSFAIANNETRMIFFIFIGQFFVRALNNVYDYRHTYVHHPATRIN